MKFFKRLLNPKQRTETLHEQKQITVPVSIDVMVTEVTNMQESSPSTYSSSDFRGQIVSILPFPILNETIGLMFHFCSTIETQSSCFVMMAVQILSEGEVL